MKAKWIETDPRFIAARKRWPDFKITERGQFSGSRAVLATATVNGETVAVVAQLSGRLSERMAIGMLLGAAKGWGQ